MGLLGVIRMQDADLTTLALGTDPTTLGLALNSPGPVWPSFASPWADGPLRPEPAFGSPASYLHAPPRLQPGYFARFQLETLFYIFYAMPGDEAQVFAADELASRGWTFHREYRTWIARPPGAEPATKTATSERGSYLVFDTAAWETVRKDNFVLVYEALERPPGLPRGAPPPGGGGGPPPPLPGGGPQPQGGGAPGPQ
jgi:CCR4-NOT transcription complex subunit 2